MSRIDIGQSITNPKVVPATAKGFYKAVDSEKTGRICAELEDALEQVRRGEISKDEYKTIKAEKKKGCKFYTPHAHFKNGYKRRDGGPWDSGKAIIDFDGCEHFEQLYEAHLKGHEKELGINMVNISVSKTGGHILFDIPEGLTRQQAQAWMANEVLGGVGYDKAVHERERAVYIPCRQYILYLDEELMFSDQPHPAKLSEEVLQKYKKKVKSEELRVKNLTLNQLWNRRQCTKFNGTSYLSQRAAEAIYTPEGKQQVRSTIKYYMNNAKLMREALTEMGFKVYGGEDAPYLWVGTPGSMSSWDFFDWMLRSAHVVCTPGSGFGPSGEGFVRLTAFGTHENTEKALHRIANRL